MPYIFRKTAKRGCLVDIKGGNLTKHRKNIAVLGLLIAIAVTGLLWRLAFLMILRSEH